MASLYYKCNDLFIVEHYMTSCSYLTFQNGFRDTFIDSPVPDKSATSRLVNRFRGTIILHQVDTHQEKDECMLCRMRWIFAALNLTLYFVFCVMYF